MPKISETDLIINPDGSVYHLNLKPEHVSEKIITVGDPSRVHRISSHFDNVDFEMNKREFITHTGMYKGKRLTVISTGMGTDNVEILMNELDALFNIDLKTREVKEKPTSLKIVRIGTSGSIQEDMRLGTHVMSEYGIGMDPMMHFYEFEMGTFEKEIAKSLQKAIGLPYSPYVVKGSEELIELFKDLMTPGNTLTCHGFYGPQGRTLRVPIKYPDLVDKLTYFHHNDFWISNLEMETAGYYGLAKVLGHEMISLNAIIANRVRNRFSKDPNKVIDSLIKKVLDRI
ncbi:MAG: phosphorylase [Flammeovirgaceae bacterium]|nr:phosphorylase [Flammeovirgaceae bacterium]